MNCKNCGTQIADNALICYRCGNATSEPIHQAAQSKGRSPTRSWGVLVVVLVCLVAAVVFLSQNVAGELGAPFGLSALAVAGILLVWWLRRR